jgi:hypothetical protein
MPCGSCGYCHTTLKPRPLLVTRTRLFEKYLDRESELPDADLRYSTGFPIQWQPPPGLRSSFGLTLPPRAGVLVPKTHTFSCNTPRLAWFSHRGIMVKLMQLYQRICSFLHPPRRCSTLRSEFDSLGGIVNSLAFIPTLGYARARGFCCFS